MTRIRPLVAAALAACTWWGGSSLARAQQPAPEGERVKALEDEVNQLKQTIEQLKQQERDHEEKLILPVLQQRQEIERQKAEFAAQQAAAQPAPPAPPPPPAAPPPPFGTLNLGGFQVRIFGHVALRYDYSTSTDPTDTLLDDIVANGFRLRIRLGAEFGDPNGPINGGFRFATGQTPNPTVAFAFIGDGFRPKSVGFDTFWFQVRPLADRDRLGLIFGKMPNPIWRGTSGTFRSELTWDDDVQPEGVAWHLTLYKSKVDKGDKPAIKLDNVAAYYQVTELQRQRFVGLTGVTSLFADQLRFFSKYVDAAVAFYDYENLNNGLEAGGIDFGAGYVSPQPSNSAYLLRAGLSPNNNKVNVGRGALAFVSDNFRLLNPTAQVHIPISAPRLGDPDIWLLVDYSHNFSVSRDADGVRATIGARLGSYKNDFHPLNIWLTYGYVQADATLAAFADSDLGAGTGYNGLEAGVNYRFYKNFMASVSYFHFIGYPLNDQTINRLFLDVVGDF